MKKSHKMLLFVTAIACVAYFTHETPQQKEVRYIRRGNEYFDKGEYRKARLEYRNAAKLMPTDPEVSYRWALVDEAEGDIRSAFNNLLYTEQQAPHFHPAILKLAHYYLVVEQYNDVQKRIDAVLTDTPDDPEAHALEAALALRVKDYATTEKEARFALGKDPANITAISVLTGMYMAENDIARAGEMVNEGIARNPQDLSILLLKSRLYEQANDLPKIDETYQQIFKLRPKDSQFRVYLSDIYMKTKKTDEAEAVLRAGVTALPDDWSLKHSLVDFLADQRSVEVAEKEIRGYMQAHPDNGDLYFWLASIYMKHKAEDKAVALLEEVVAKDQSNKESLSAQTSLARIHFLKGDKELAQKMVATVLDKAPDNAEALFIRANMAADQGLYQNAVSDLRIILRDQPQNADAMQLLGEVLMMQGYPDLAIETFSQLMDLEPGNPAVKVRLAQIYAANKDTAHALDLMALVNKTNPDYAAGWENTTRIAISAKDWAKATSALRHLDALPGQHTTATLLKGWIEAHGGKPEDAIASYKQVIDADPSSPLAEHALYSLVNDHQDPQDLEATVQYIASLKTDSPYVSTLLGECYAALGKDSLATAAFTKAIGHNATMQDPYIDQAKLYLKDQKNDLAIDLLKKAAIAIPSDSRAQLIQGSLLAELGEYTQAITVYDDLLKRWPALDVAANNLASLIADHAYTDPAMLDKAAAAAEHFKTSADARQLDTLGWIYYRQNRLDQAARLLSQAAAQDKAPPEIHYHYAIVLLKKGNKAQAKAELVKATPAGAHYPALDDAQRELKNIK